MERVTGTFKEARGLYLDAISIAHRQEYTLLEGHLNECLGELYLSAVQYPERVFFAEAARLYRRCLAERKELSLVERYSEYFEEEDGDLYIRAESHAADRDATKTLNQKIQEAAEVCKAVVRYVFRTRNSLN